MAIQHARIDGVSNQQILSTLLKKASAMEKKIMDIASRSYTLLADFLMYFISEGACRSYLEDNSVRFSETTKEVFLADHIVRKMGKGAPRDPAGVHFSPIFPVEDDECSAWESFAVTQRRESRELSRGA
ncbi:MAG: hypothetical protein AAGI90_04265 [Chlamydiota bacterium]